MASSRPPRASTTTWCGRCGAYLSVAPGSRSVRCALCHAVTYVERRPHGLHHAAIGFIKGLISAIVSPPPSSSPSLRPGGAAFQLPASYPRVRGCKKRALLVGISYAGSQYELKGTVNDVNCMAYLLRQRFGFPSDCILVLTEDDKDPFRVPTRVNLLHAMRWLVDGTTSGDSLVFHFSGHGVQKLDNNGDEVDGYDEALCPLDFQDRGVILDDEINAIIVRSLCWGVKLHAIVDTCHSGTILDLPYLCRISRTGYWQWENHSRPSGEPKCTNGGLAISISGCGDSQTSQDTTAFSGSASTGAMTYSFIKAVESEPGTTYGRLLTAMRATIRDNGGEFGIPGPIGAFFRRVITFSCAQEPQLCSSEPFDIYKKPFLL
ncbi:metacaspase-1-like [Phragmites australis]|uniref:metacaspase-1-like n=1 Tax=Phragmites australis TaxID=29695 RepID=UPI002D796B2B|nr:metacaspase-1-like [Phragmites australis]